MASEGPLSAAEHFPAEQDVLQPITLTNGDLHAVTEQHAQFDLKYAEDVAEVEAHDVSLGASEEIGRASLDSITDKSQLPRPYEPVAKTLDSEADKENALDPESAHASESIISTPVELADVSKAVEETSHADVACDATAADTAPIAPAPEVHQSVPEPVPVEASAEIHDAQAPAEDITAVHDEDVVHVEQPVHTEASLSSEPEVPPSSTEAQAPASELEAPVVEAESAATQATSAVEADVSHVAPVEEEAAVVEQTPVVEAETAPIEHAAVEIEAPSVEAEATVAEPEPAVETEASAAEVEIAEPAEAVPPQPELAVETEASTPEVPAPSEIIPTATEAPVSEVESTPTATTERTEVEAVVSEHEVEYSPIAAVEATEHAEIEASVPKPEAEAFPIATNDTTKDIEAEAAAPELEVTASVPEETAGASEEAPVVEPEVVEAAPESLPIATDAPTEHIEVEAATLEPEVAAPVPAEITEAEAEPPVAELDTVEHIPQVPVVEAPVHVEPEAVAVESEAAHEAEPIDIVAPALEPEITAVELVAAPAIEEKNPVPTSATEEVPVAVEAEAPTHSETSIEPEAEVPAGAPETGKEVESAPFAIEPQPVESEIAPVEEVAETSVVPVEEAEQVFAAPQVSEHEAAPVEAEVEAVAPVESEALDVEDVVTDIAHLSEESAAAIEVTPEVAVEQSHDVVAEAPVVNSEELVVDAKEPVIASEEPIVNTEISAVEENQEVIAQDADTLSVNTGDEIERPRSPWTPSYSVTTQGPGEPTTAEPEEAGHTSPPSVTPEIVFDHVEPAEHKFQATVVEAAAVPEPEADVVHTGESAPKPASLVATDSASLHAGVEESKEERPKSPWTPSYSVTTQGTVTNDAAELEQLDQLPPSVVLIDAFAEVVEAAEPVVEAETVAAEDAVHSTQAVAHSPSIPAIAVTPSEEHKELPASGAADVEPELASFGDVAVPQLILDTSEPEKISDEERPKSPWTPSYSVTTQGSVTEASEESEQPISAVEAAVPAEVTVVAEPAVDVAESLVIPSIDITENPEVHEEASSAHEVIDATNEEDVAPSEEPSEDVTLPKSPSQLSISIPSASPVGDEDRPKSPWTPSYSVTTQGSVLQDSAELEQLEQLPPSGVEAAETPVAVENVVDVLPFVHVPEPEVQAEAIPAPVEAEPLAKEQKVEAPADISLVIPENVVPDRPASPWTPSYSVTTQGPGDVQKAEQAESVLPKDEPFPVASDVKFEAIAKKPSQLHLTTSDTKAKVEELTSAASRNRIESTSSSRFFPGGWFSSSPTVPAVNRTRTSTDVATGEFVRSASSESATAESEFATTPIVSPGDEEKKTRWCTIM